MTDDEFSRLQAEAAAENARKIEEYKAGHEERMAAAQARVDENLRQEAIRQERENRRNSLVSRILAVGGVVHDGNCCENERVDLPATRHDGGSVNINLDELGHEGDPELLVLEVIALVLESYNA